MITKKLFVGIMNILAQQHNDDMNVAKNLNNILIDSRGIFYSKCIEKIITLLDKELDTDFVSWWWFEVDKSTDNTVMFDQVKKMVVRSNNASDLYDVIMVEKER